MPGPAVLERLAQLGPAPVNPAADGAELDAERVGDLLVGQALDVAQDDRGPVLRRQGLERGLDVAVEVPVVEYLGRRRLGAADAGRRLLAQALEPDPLPAAGHVQEQVCGDAVQPALEGARRVRGQRAEDAHEDLLGEILGVVGVTGEPVGQPVDPGRVVTDHVLPGRRRPVGAGLGLIEHGAVEHGCIELVCPGRSGLVHGFPLHPLPQPPTP